MFSLSVHIRSHQFTSLLSVFLILPLIQKSFLKFLTCLISPQISHQHLRYHTSQHQLKLSINKILTNFFLSKSEKKETVSSSSGLSLGFCGSEVKVKKNYPTKLEPLYLDKSSIYTAYVKYFYC